MNCVTCGSNKLHHQGANIYKCLTCRQVQRWDGHGMVLISGGTGGSTQPQPANAHPSPHIVGSALICPGCSGKNPHYLGGDLYQCSVCSAQLRYSHSVGNLLLRTSKQQQPATPIAPKQASGSANTTMPTHGLMCPACSSSSLHYLGGDLYECKSCGRQLRYNWATGNLVLSAPMQQASAPVVLKKGGYATGTALNVDPQNTFSESSVTLDNGKVYIADHIGKQLRSVSDLQDTIPFDKSPYCEKCCVLMSFYGVVDSKTDYYDCKCGEVRQLPRRFREKPTQGSQPNTKSTPML